MKNIPNLRRVVKLSLSRDASCEQAQQACRVPSLLTTIFGLAALAPTALLQASRRVQISAADHGARWCTPSARLAAPRRASGTDGAAVDDGVAKRLIRLSWTWVHRRAAKVRYHALCSTNLHTTPPMPSRTCRFASNHSQPPSITFARDAVAGARASPTKPRPLPLARPQM